MEYAINSGVRRFSRLESLSIYMSHSNGMSLRENDEQKDVAKSGSSLVYFIAYYALAFLMLFMLLYTTECAISSAC